MKNKKILYGIIGVGHLGNFHTQQSLKISNFNLIGVYDTNHKRGKEIALKYKTIYFDNIQSLLIKCDAVSIVTPAVYHYKMATIALKNNCHIFIEKPFTTSIKDAKKLISLAAQFKKIIQIGHIEQFNPVFKKFLQYKPKPLFVDAERLAPFNKRGTDVDVVLDLMIHDIDLILSLIDSKLKKVSANGVKILSQSYDLVCARLEFDNGAIANLTASRLSENPVRKLRVFESNLYSSLDLQNLSISRCFSADKTSSNKNVLFEFENKAITKTIVRVEPKNALYEELDSFSQSITNNQAIAVDGYKGLETLKIAFLIQKKINEQKL